MKPHKWAKEIKAWADGAEIEFSYDEKGWCAVGCPSWFEDGVFYRIKPKTRKAIIDGVEYTLPEPMKESGVGFYVYSDGEISPSAHHLEDAVSLNRCFATIEDAELFAKAEKALRGIL